MSATRKFDGTELVLASHNKGKLAEIHYMFAGSSIAITSAADYHLDEPVETEDNFVGNALIKARYVAAKTGKPALADDSGFCVEALGGAPGVYTADWEADENGVRTAETARKRIEKEVGDHPNRNASMVSVLVLCWPDGHCEVVEGIARGQLVLPPRGNNGFGQDPIFQPEGSELTFAEMTKEQKEKFSHRAKAFRLMMDECF